MKTQERKILLKLQQYLKEHQSHETARLSQFGDKCSMGRCAMSRLHLLSDIDTYLNQEIAKVTKEVA